MILDLDKFLAGERPYWEELESILSRLETDPAANPDFEQLQRFHYLYQRSMADLAKLSTFAAAPDIHRYLESLVARAYGEEHETRQSRARFAPWRWFFHTFPQTFRRRAGAFWLACAITVVGCGFGCLALAIDPDAKQVIMPFEGLAGNPRDRVRKEESARNDELHGVKGRFSAQLMTHNTQVALFTMALGMTWGVGTVISLFYNGVVLGAVSWDYTINGQARFLAGWLLPHGSVEIPAILLAGQAGFVLAGALIGWGRREGRRQRLREVSSDLVTIIGGAACLLVWAGLVEAFLSQYHEPVIPYELKIGFGLAQLTLLILFLAKSGTKSEKHD
jgi:uncharacterized membrane protein SpoIIM required for sporulation